jgi:predicted CoA-substrate-specific enzyme activase
MEKIYNILGLDVGSVSVAVVIVDPEKKILAHRCQPHLGNVRETLQSILSGFDLSGVGTLAVTSSSAGIINGAREYDSRVALIKGVMYRHPGIRSLIYIGGERFGFIEFDEDGAYRKSKTNSSCAAGTGSFLDQQAKRLSLSGIEEFCEIASRNTGDIPKIASRCAVFAKTDLIHAQQEGFSLSEICDGLCQGLAKNIADTISTGEKILSPVFFAGGVAKNSTVAKYLKEALDVDFIIDEYSTLYGAIGAAYSAIDEGHLSDSPVGNISALLNIARKNKSYQYEPLELKLSDHPSFASKEKYLYNSKSVDSGIPVEVDIYAQLDENSSFDAYIGIDIGSTSTKAALVSGDRVMGGFYTRTSGRPLEATRAIFESIDDIIQRKNISMSIIGAGTTGSGRKFIGRLIGADLVVDEITAHARAAFQLNPRIDTIIEIGGQDAKFTTLRNGMVNFSVMNTVCAAGTGSFIEEQAERLDCRLADISARTEGKRAPMASDRCTVFMERDINHILSNGHEVDEALASVLHSVRDNYLSKVAVEGAIGDVVCFQGATAKNKMLVAAFEQKLEKKIHVSEYCHLTGALGVAYLLSENRPEQTLFRGISLYSKEIPVENEICDLCANHCKIKIAHIDSDSVAYGFLCGRDYDTKKFIDRNISGFDLIKERARVTGVKTSNTSAITVGIPATLHLVEEIPLWKTFFERLGIHAVSSESLRDAAKKGKNISGAEFCSPMSAMHGHIAYLAGKCDFVFFPVYIEGREIPKGTRRQFCYYTQYSPSLGANLAQLNGREGTIISPVVNHAMSIFHNTVHLYRAIKKILPNVSYYEIYSAYEDAKDAQSAINKKLVKLYEDESLNDDLKVVFLGRPYTVLVPSMNKNIPGIFSSLGVKTFFQDMIPYTKEDVKEIDELLDAFHMHYAAKILEVANVAAKKEGLYPVLITSFKCAPDSFVIEYFRRMMDQYDKPYLILQLDDHDSNVGYETRIEAALRAFRNHHEGKSHPVLRRKLPYLPKVTNKLAGKTLLLPNWDSLSCRFLSATLIREGIDARMLDETDSVIQKSMRHNTGQCIPINAIAQEVIEYIETQRLHPEHTALWMFHSEISCNVKMYPYYIKSILEAHGKGFEKTEIYVGDVTFTDFGPMVSLNIYYAYLFAGMLRKLVCRIRPYEVNKGETDRVLAECAQVVYGSIISGADRENTAKRIVELFSKIERTNEDRPKVAIFGDMYTRDNDVMNQNLVRTIEDAGGEVISTSYTEYIRMIASPYFRRWFSEGKYGEVVTGETIMAIISRIDRKYFKIFEPLLGVSYPEFDMPVEDLVAPYNVTVQHTGESLDNLIKIAYLLRHYPDISLFVQASPAFCCPSLVTEAMIRDIERITGVPVVPVVYDGTGSFKNDIVVPYIKFPRRKETPKEDCGIS